MMPDRALFLWSELASFAAGLLVALSYFIVVNGDNVVTEMEGRIAGVAFSAGILLLLLSLMMITGLTRMN